MEPFHERLKRLRESRRLTMKAVANMISVPETTYREWEYGRAIQGQPYVRLADALGVSLSELMTGRRPDRDTFLRTLEQLETSVAQLKREYLSTL